MALFPVFFVGDAIVMRHRCWFSMCVKRMKDEYLGPGCLGRMLKTLFLLSSSSKGERFLFAVNVRDIIVYIYKVGPLLINF